MQDDTKAISPNSSPSLIAGQMFGLPISRVQDVFKPARITRVPLRRARSPACSICAAAS
jgi:hypothetical protein